VRLRVCARVGSSAAACRRLRAVPLQAARCSRTAARVPVQALERAKGGGIPTGGVLEVVAWQTSERGGQRRPGRQQTWRWSCMMRRGE
jgi:hypothetical protein